MCWCSEYALNPTLAPAATARSERCSESLSSISEPPVVTSRGDNPARSAWSGFTHGVWGRALPGISSTSCRLRLERRGCRCPCSFRGRCRDVPSNYDEKPTIAAGRSRSASRSFSTYYLHGCRRRTVSSSGWCAGRQVPSRIRGHALVMTCPSFESSH